MRPPGTSGLEFQRTRAGSADPIPIIFITGRGDVPMSVEAMKGGAIEFLTKPFREQDLLESVQRGIRLDRERRAEIVRDAALLDRHARLTPREREVMALVAAGHTNKGIARLLDISEVTVKVHRGHLTRKMEAGSLAELGRMADTLARIIPKA